MLMKIKIIAIGSVSKYEKYSQFEVTYRNLDKDKVEAKKLVDFNYLDVYKTLLEAVKDDVYVVTAEKGDKYWNWVDVKKTTETVMSDPVAPKQKEFGTTYKGSYETPEERAAKNRSILRQVALKCATELVAAFPKDKQTKEVLFDVAADMEQWLVREDVMGMIKEMKDDIPE